MIDTVDLVKIICMILMFSCIMIVGSLPLRWNTFRNSKKLASFASAFSGGLFLSVGVLHLMPEAQENLNDYYQEQGDSPDQDHFPFINFTTVVCFALILFIEKIAFDHHEDHQHSQGGGESMIGSVTSRSYLKPLRSNQSQFEEQAKLLIPSPENINPTIDQEESDFKDTIRPQAKVAAKLSYAQLAKRSILADPGAKEYFKDVNQWTPYILQIAIGIHAVFEGMAIGIQTELSNCLGISAAVLCHKWAEGLTLGNAFFKAGVDVKTSTIMIAIQAIMNPIGIALGWILSNQGLLVTGIFEGISAGTFLYIATGEVIVEEFNISRYKWAKYCVFLVAIGFVSSLYFIEQATGG